ncbi:MAG: BlaI/MecI/CopY family transcriptional regulator [Candidatus Hydrogenedentes bacterium]|nr:BlaI/MecI/CopY family transcriptional regulator [Candidatus Hydrogenedentota bacterium]
MPGKQTTPNPTQGELAILRVLWEQGPSTVRAVWEKLNSQSGTGYTTALKLMQIMAQKGLVSRDESQKTHVYRAAIAKANTERRLVRDVLDRVFGGSAERLVMRALEEKDIAPDELARIQELLDRKGREQS